jgi:NADPH:quinone reductase-like Zn-dependent oxidoreductase
VLVQAGSSATGQACVDVARARGARVYATASARKLGRVAALGAEALAYDDPRLAQLGADVVFDPVGAATFDCSVAALARGGRVVTPGAVGDSHVSFDVWALVGKAGKILGTGSAPIVGDTIRRLIDLAAEGRIDPVIDRELPLEQAADAHRAIEARETFGKVILRP